MSSNEPDELKPFLEHQESENVIRLNTSICRMCVGNTENGHSSMLPMIVSGNMAYVKCPNGERAALDEKAPPTCMYITEQSILQDDPLPLPIVEEDS